MYAAAILPLGAVHNMGKLLFELYVMVLILLSHLKCKCCARTCPPARGSVLC